MSKTGYYIAIFCIYSFFYILKLILTPLFGVIWIFDYLIFIANSSFFLCVSSKSKNIYFVVIEILSLLSVAYYIQSSFIICIFVILPLIINLIYLFCYSNARDRINYRLSLILNFIFFLLTMSFPFVIAISSHNYIHVFVLSLPFVICNIILFFKHKMDK